MLTPVVIPPAARISAVDLAGLPLRRVVSPGAPGNRRTRVHVATDNIVRLSLVAAMMGHPVTT